MTSRVYVLLDILENQAAATIQNLQRTEGVVAIDALEGHPNFLLIVEAPDRQKLVESMMPALSLLERVTKDLRLLLIRENYQPSPVFDTGNLESLSTLRPVSVTPRVPVNSLVS
jgi:hypothetical protein